MPATEVRAFKSEDGEVPVQDFLDNLQQHEPKVYEKCLARILELAEKGYEMRRPSADYLRDGIYELRATRDGVHYRLLYFFYGQCAVAISHGITKEDKVPPKEINLAIERMKLVKKSRTKYTTDLTINI